MTVSWGGGGIPDHQEPDGGLASGRGHKGRGQITPPADTHCRTIVTERKPRKPTRSVQGNGKEDKIHRSLRKEGLGEAPHRSAESSSVLAEGREGTGATGPA